MGCMHVGKECIANLTGTRNQYVHTGNITQALYCHQDCVHMSLGYVNKDNIHSHSFVRNVPYYNT